MDLKLNVYNETSEQIREYMIAWVITRMIPLRGRATKSEGKTDLLYVSLFLKWPELPDLSYTEASSQEFHASLPRESS